MISSQCLEVRSDGQGVAWWRWHGPSESRGSCVIHGKLGGEMGGTMVSHGVPTVSQRWDLVIWCLRGLLFGTLVLNDWMNMNEYGWILLGFLACVSEPQLKIAQEQVNLSDDLQDCCSRITTRNIWFSSYWWFSKECWSSRTARYHGSKFAKSIVMVNGSAGKRCWPLRSDKVLWEVLLFGRSLCSVNAHE